MERWSPIRDGKLEVSDQRRVRRVSPWRGMGDAVRLEPVLTPAELAAEGLDVEALATKAFGARELVPAEKATEARVDPETKPETPKTSDTPKPETSDTLKTSDTPKPEAPKAPTPKTPKAPTPKSRR
jgi:outer membrane biosynthesis protein TonB